MTTVRCIRILRRGKPDPTPISGEHPTDPVILHEDGMWAVWYDDVRFPSRAFAAAVAAKERRHDHDYPFQE